MSDYVAIKGSKQQAAQVWRELSDVSLQGKNRCRYPLFAHYMASSDALTIETPCSPILPFMVQDEEKGWQLEELDIQRVDEVHVLFAGKGQEAASRYGHVMLRLVVCPETIPQGMSRQRACQLNLDQHRVLGFQAYVDDIQIGYWKGLFGGYRARLWAMRFLEVYERYASGDFREIYSLPLQLDAAEKENLLRGMTQFHWSHDSSYRFFTNNCATLLQMLLQKTWSAYQADRQLRRQKIRPDSWFEKLMASDLAHSELVTDQQQAKKEGYYFPDNRRAFERASTLVRATIESPSFEGIEDYAAQSAMARREALNLKQQDGELVDSGVYPEELKHARLLVEEYALMQAEKNLLRSVQPLFDVNKNDWRIKGWQKYSQKEQMLLERCLLNRIKQRISPPESLLGIPEGDEITFPLPENDCSQEDRTDFRQFIQVKMSTSSSWKRLFDAVSELAETVENMDLLYQSLYH